MSVTVDSAWLADLVADRAVKTVPLSSARDEMLRIRAEMARRGLLPHQLSSTGTRTASGASTRWPRATSSSR